MYQEDSFYTLSLYGRLGVFALGAVMIALVAGVSMVLMQQRRIAVRLAVAAFMFTLFVWLSPQAYYALYRVLFDGLPQQWVIGPPPPLDELLDLVTFTGRQTLAAHAQGGVFWGLVWLSWRFRPKAEVAPDPDP